MKKQCIFLVLGLALVACGAGDDTADGSYSTMIGDWVRIQRTDLRQGWSEGTLLSSSERGVLIQLKDGNTSFIRLQFVASVATSATPDERAAQKAADAALREAQRKPRTEANEFVKFVARRRFEELEQVKQQRKLTVEEMENVALARGCVNDNLLEDCDRLMEIGAQRDQL